LYDWNGSSGAASHYRKRSKIGGNLHFAIK